MPKTIFAVIAIGIALNATAAQLTIAEKLSDIMNSKEQIRQAIESQGVQMPTTVPLSQYSSKIGQITRGAICSATSPSSCGSIANTTSVNENPVSGCSGGNAYGSAVAAFVVGGYCSATAGQGNAPNPQIQACSNCTAATSASGSQRYCYCKIHSINGLAVAASSRFVYVNDRSNASGCAVNCTYNCAYDALNYSACRTALFSALGN